MTTDSVTADKLRQKVRQGYSEISKKGVFSVVDSTGCAPGGGCCGGEYFDVEALVSQIGYSESELKNLPESANMGLSCGNPTALASLQSGEVVLDLGSGGGFDVFIAGPKVGASGKVIGVDMTPEMISKARKNSQTYSERTGLNNVEFRLGEIEHLPVADNSVDVVISNCVLNLSPDKSQVWKEIARVLKPGGRVAVSDLALLKPLPQSVTSMIDALVGCIAGACLISEIENDAKSAGLTDLSIEKKSDYIQTLVSFEDPLYKKVLEAMPKGTKLDDFITSADIVAVKAS